MNSIPPSGKPAKTQCWGSSVLTPAEAGGQDNAVGHDDCLSPALILFLCSHEEIDR